MAYQVQFFCRSQTSDLREAVAHVQGSIGDRRQDIAFEAANEGQFWRSLEMRTVAGSAIRVVIHHRDDVVQSEVQRVASEPGAPDLSGVDMLIDVLLSGEVDMDAIRTLWQVLVDEFAGIPFDEASGFEASIE